MTDEIRIGTSLWGNDYYAKEAVKSIIANIFDLWVIIAKHTLFSK